MAPFEDNAAPTRPLDEFRDPKDVIDAEFALQRWYPPMAVWRLFLLIFLTFTVYTLFWSGRLAKDLRAHVDPRIKPWKSVVGLIIPIVGFGIVYRQTRHIRDLNAAVGQSSKFGPELVMFVFIVVYFASLASNLAADDLGETLSSVLSLVVVATYSVPWLLMQHDLNRYKAKLAGVQWTSHPNRYNGLQRVTVALGSLFMVAVIAGVTIEFDGFIDRQQGQALARGAHVAGSSGAYQLLIPEDGWAKLKPGRLSEDADLELMGTSSTTYVIGYVGEALNVSMDDFVANRRALIREDWPEVKVTEERRLLPGTIVPVSFARYESTDLDVLGTTFILVTTVVADGKTIEIVGATESIDSHLPQIEAITKSVRLTQEGN